MDDKIFKNAFEYKVIYIFTIEDKAHCGLLKIGDTTLYTETAIDHLHPNCHELNQTALKRIKTYTSTVGLIPRLLWTEIAIRTHFLKNGTVKLEAFRDYHIHKVLKNSGIKPRKLGSSREWFELDLSTAKQAIIAVKLNYANLSNSKTNEYYPIVFRPEQNDCIEKVVKHFKKSDRFLINAKMRYGKTLVSLEIVKRCKFKKTIIVTHRPVVDDGWYKDFNKIFYGTEYIYGSKQSGYTLKKLIKTGKPYIYFASVQDLRGSSQVGGKFDKNNLAFSTVWDCLIVDEAHEGTTTPLGEKTLTAVFKEGNGTKLLALSGTPFNILQDYDDNSIYTWDYIMEQECKTEWDKYNFGDSNPYDELPVLKIYTYSLGDILKTKDNFYTFEDKAFNFKEFFRTFTGDISIDNDEMPTGSKAGDFVHKDDVSFFLNLMTKQDDNNYYPYSNEEYRTLFKHSLWIVPGVKEARALKKLMLEHSVFGCGQFNIINVAGDDEVSDEALSKVRTAIENSGDDYTITLSCGRLTTGVTVKEWTAVFMLAGSYSTSAANYLQTIFRVQSPCNQNGRIKVNAYVFDFAPDRTLKMISSAVSVSSKRGKSKITDKQIMRKFLNYCPVISISGSKMRKYSATLLLQQLKKAYADKVVSNGFDDSNLYNDELLKLKAIDIQKFDELKGIIGTSKVAPKANDITINAQGLTDEEYEEIENLSERKRKKQTLTEEEKERLEELKKIKKVRDNAISILRGISIRMPLLIYGADIPYDEEITLDKFIDAVDDSSWKEFMPIGVTKDRFREFQKYYDEEIFIAAGHRIRNIAKEADTLEPTKRVIKIASLFTNFKNPDKETVLTPWRVVNMHMSDTLGGWDFWDEEHQNTIDTPRFVDRGTVTKEVFAKDDTQILEINSKTGLYPLYVAYSCYRAKLDKINHNKITVKEKQALWAETVEENIYVICKTPMAKAITKRTLLGYTNAKCNTHCFDDLINTLKNKSEQFCKRVLRGNFWGKEAKNMKFDAVVGNPPYQEETGSDNRQAKPVYNHFVIQAKALNPNYISMITPSRWFAGGMGLDTYRINMMTDKRIIKLVDFTNAKDCFPQISISGGVSYFLRGKEDMKLCEVINIHAEKKNIMDRSLSEFPILVRYNEAVSILRKVLQKKEKTLDTIVSSISPYGLPTNFRGQKTKDTKHSIRVFTSTGKSYISEKDILKGNASISKYRTMISQTSAEHAGEPSRDGTFRVLTKSMCVLKPKDVCTHSYIYAGEFNNEICAKNLLKYLKTKFARFLILQTLTSIHLSKSTFIFVPMQDFSISWNDKALFEKYGISPDEIKFIDSMIKPMQ